MQHIFKSLVGAGLALGFISATSISATAALITPPFRGDANTEYGFWDIFVDEYTAEANIGTVGEGNPVEGGTSGAMLYQTLTPVVFVTGGGNIYSPEAVTGFVIEDTPAFTPGIVFLQIRSIGSEFDYSSFALNINGSSLEADEFLELSRVPFPGFGGDTVEFAVQWNLADDAALFSGGNDYSLTFVGAESSVSLDYVALDVAADFQNVIPEPSALWLLGLAGLLLSFRRRRGSICS